MERSAPKHPGRSAPSIRIRNIMEYFHQGRRWSKKYGKSVHWLETLATLEKFGWSKMASDRDPVPSPWDHKAIRIPS
jgi:hypothetical protein